MIIKTFDELVTLLKEHEYTVEVTKHRYYKFCKVTGNNIIGGFSTKAKCVYQDISNAICVDHINCFDKWSKCPIKISFPLESSVLLEYMKFMGTIDGFKNSNSYDYLDNDLYPYKGENNGKK